MFDRDDNIYGDGGGVVSGITKTALIAGAGYGGFRLIKDKNSFKGAYNKVLDAVAPVQPINISGYEKMVNNMRDISTSASARRVGTSSIRKEQAESVRLSNLPPKDGLLKPISSGADIYHELGSLNFNKGGWDNVVGLDGSSIGGEIKSLLEKSGMELKLDETIWKGTMAVIPTANGSTINIPFASYTKEGHSIAKKAGATYVAPSFYENIIDESTGKLSGKVGISGWNEQIREMLGDEVRMKTLALANEDASKLIAEISNSPRALREYTLKKGAHSTAMSLIENSKKQQIFKMALKTLAGKEEMFIAPTNNMSLESQTGILRADVYSSLNREMANPGAYATRAGKSSMHNGGDRKPTSKNIQESFMTPMNARPDQISLLHGTDTNSLDYTKGLFGELNQAGLTPLVSAGQVPSRTFYAGGELYGLPAVEGYKSVTPFGYYKPVGMSKQTQDYRYRSRYTTKAGGSGERLGNAITRNRGNYSKLGYINFASDEEILLNAKDSASMIIDAPITVGFRQYDQDIANKKITVKSVNGNVQKDFTLGDLYDGKSQGHKELSDLMLGNDEYRIYGLNKGTKLGITTDARPISGIDDPLGVEVVGGYKRLKQNAYMGREEFSYFVSSLKNMHPDSEVSMPLRTMSQQTKAAVAGTNVRASVTYINKFSGSTGIDSSSMMHRAMEALHGKNLDSNVVGTFGSKLFKGAIPNMVDGDLIAGKNIQELQQFLHSSILGHAEDIRLTTGKGVYLDGDIARKFAHMTNTKTNAAGIFNLTDFIDNGKFIMSSNKGVIEQHLNTSLDILGVLRQHYEGLGSSQSGKINIKDSDMTGAREYLTKAWNEIQSTATSMSEGFGDAARSGKRYSGFNGGNAREVLWPFMAALSGMENKELSQGAKAFNTARFSMRDQYMFLGGKEGILGELLERNSVDSIRLMRESELLHSSVGGQTAQKNMTTVVNDYVKFLEDTYGPTNKHVMDYAAVLNNNLTEEQMKENVGLHLGTESLNINEPREHSDIATRSFLSEEKNPFGKLVKTKSGGLFHMPSASAIGGMTLLPNEKITFEGKFGGNVAAFWNIANDINSNGGRLSELGLENHRFSVYNTAEDIVKSRAAIHIEDALYARNITDARTTQHDAMTKLSKYFTEATDADRAVIGNIATISRSDAEALISDRISQVIHKKSNLLVEDLNALRGDWLMDDHGHTIAERLNKGTLKDKTSINKLAKDIVDKRVKRTYGLTRRLDNLNQLMTKEGSKPEEIAKLVSSLSSYIERAGFASIAQRNPVIYAGSVSGVRTFIRPDSISKSLSLGFIANLNLKADWDGDKIQYTPLYSGSANESVNLSMKGIQMKTEKFMLEAGKRMKTARQTPTFTISNRRMKGISNAIMNQRNASTYAAFMTKAFTGTMDIAALATKGHFERAVRNGKLSGGQIEEVLAWTRSIPSLMTEQQVISSKHLESLVSGSTAGKTRVEHIMGNIGKIEPEKMMEIIKDSGGTVHPVVQMSLAKMMDDPTTRMRYRDAIEYSNLSLDIQTGMRRVSQGQLDKWKHIIGPNMTPTQWADHTSRILSDQDAFIPIAERESFKLSGFNNDDGFLDILAKGNGEQSNNLNVMMTQLEKHFESVEGGLENVDPGEFNEALYNLRMKQVNISGEMYQSSVIGGSETEGRQLRWASKVIPHIENAMEWIKEAPLRRLGGIGLTAMAATMASNLLFSDNTPSSIRDIPSRSSNPLMDARGGSYGMGGEMSTSSNLNSNVGLLSSSSIPHINVISSINSVIGNRGGHSVSVRSDTTNPYAEQMSYYN